MTAINGYMGFSDEQYSTLAVILTGCTGLLMLYKVCAPFNFLRGALALVMTAAFVLALILMGNFFSISPLNLPMVLVLMMMLLFAFCSMSLFLHLIDYILIPRLDKISMEVRRQSRLLDLFRRKLFRKGKRDKKNH